MKPDSNTAAPLPEEINMLVILFQQGQLTEGETLARSLTLRFPDHGFGWKVLGAVLKQQGRLEEALSAMRQAVILQPNDYAAQSNLGLLLMSIGLFAEAEKSYRATLALNADFAEAHNNLGIILNEQDRLSESETCYRRALKLKPDYSEAYYNLGNILQTQGRSAEAEIDYRQALKLKPDFAEAYNNLGINLQKQGRLSEAETCCQKALAIRPDYGEAHNNLAITLQDQGRFTESEVHYRHALDLNPDYANAHSNLLFLLNYHPDKGAEEIYAEYRLFNARFGQPLHQEWQPHPNSRESTRRLKVGYVSGDFNLHPVRHFLEPLLAHHDKTAVEIYAYAEVAVEDVMTARYRGYADHWVATAGMSDVELAARIRSDAIDILVELSGHTAKNRLGVFARKPAPVSVSWLGYGYTTGLTAIDYFLTDLAIVPPGSEGLFSETPWRLATPSCAYRPAEGMGEVSRLPAKERGHITFGTLTRAVRINHRTIRVWAEILQRVPGSHLVINSGNFKEPAMQLELSDKFIAYGIDRDRLEIGCNSPPWDVLRGMDIGLDCFPHNSGTTLFENLYMGVPFVTLAGRPSVGRLGACILEGVGHPEWIAATENEYIERAVALASDLPRLETLRADLRAEMESSPLQDEPAFVCKVETAYREMFAKWCEGGLAVDNQEEKMTGESTSQPFEEMLQQAIEHQQSGQLQEAERLYLALLQIDSNHSRLNYNLGLLAVQMEQPAVGLPYFEAALDANPEDGAYWLHYIDALAQAGRYDTACQIIEIAKQSGLQGEEVDALSVRLAVLSGEEPTVKTFPAEKGLEEKDSKKKGKKAKSAKVPGGRSGGAEPGADEIKRLVTSFTQGRYEEAEALTRTMIMRYPKHGYAWKVLGAIFRQQGLLTEALSAMSQALAFLPTDYTSMKNIAVILCDLGRYVEAEDYCHKALALNPDYAEVHNTLGIVFRSLNRQSESEESCNRALILKPGYADAYVNLGILLYDQGRVGESKICYIKALELNPNSSGAYCGLSLAQKASGKITEAEATCRRAIALKPNFPEAYNSLGGILYEQRRYEEAEVAYHVALKLKPPYVEALHNLAKTLQRQNKFAAAESIYKQVIELNPDNAVVYYDLGSSFEERGKYSKAEASYQKAVELKPDYIEAWVNLGNTLRKQGGIIKAEKSYRKALLINPDYVGATNNLGYILQEQGRLAESEVITRTILQSNPDYTEAFSNLLFLLNYHPDKGAEEIYEEYRLFNARFGQPLHQEWQPHPNSRESTRRLKVGYVSGDFNLHPVRHFL
ncbi:MAG: tetratricopeptide repeat protein, partial [Desulfoprunum sp.]|nr:tetratricopeptide repeat protein [Desulfoprunum sp.]